MAIGKRKKEPVDVLDPLDPLAQEARDTLKGSLHRGVKGNEDYNDLYQETLIRCWRHRAKESPVGLMFAIARNLTRRWHGSRKSAGVIFDSEQVETAAAEFPDSSPDMLKQFVDMETLTQVVASIPQPYRRVLLMSVCHGLTDKQIARRLGYSVESIPTYLKRARDYAKRVQPERPGKD